MTWWNKWITQARTIESLRLEASFLTRRNQELLGLLEREEQRNELLETALTTELKDHKRTLRRVADQASKQLGLPQYFVKDAEEPKPPPVIETDEAQESMIRWQAEMQRQADLDAGITAAPLDHYIEVIRQNPHKYIIG